MKLMALKLPKIVVYLFVKSSHTLDVITFFIDKMYKFCIFSLTLTLRHGLLFKSKQKEVLL